MGLIGLIRAWIGGEFHQNLLPQGLRGLNYGVLADFQGHGGPFQTDRLNEGLEGPDTGKFEGSTHLAGQQQLGPETLGPQLIFEWAHRTGISLRQIKEIRGEFSAEGHPLLRQILEIDEQLR